MIIAVSGLTVDPNGNKGSAGSGKSTVTNRIVEKHKFVDIAFADAMKRFLREVLDFSEGQLWGPSEQRNAPDTRYPVGTPPENPREELMKVCDQEVLGELLGVRNFLTPRHALQTLGTQWGRSCYSDIWVAHAMRIARRVEEGHAVYDRQLGCRYHAEVEGVMETHKHVVFSDMRFRNEFEYVKARGGKVIRVVRPVAELTIGGAHQSENDLNDVPDGAFDYVLHAQANNLPDLLLRTDEMMDWLTGRIRHYDARDENVPPFKRDELISRALDGVVGYPKVAAAGAEYIQGLLGDAKPCCSLDTDGDGDCPVHPRK